LNVERLRIYQLDGMTVDDWMNPPSPPAKERWPCSGRAGYVILENPSSGRQPTIKMRTGQSTGSGFQRRDFTRQPVPCRQSERHTPRQRPAPTSVRRSRFEAGAGPRAPGNPRAEGPASSISATRTAMATRATHATATPGASIRKTEPPRRTRLRRTSSGHVPDSASAPFGHGHGYGHGYGYG
jgi:hypothetical protein